MSVYKARILNTNHEVNGYRLSDQAISSIVSEGKLVPVTLELPSQRSIGVGGNISKDPEDGIVSADLMISSAVDLSSMYCVPAFSFVDDDLTILEDGTRILNHVTLISLCVTFDPADETLTKIQKTS